MAPYKPPQKIRPHNIYLSYPSWAKDIEYRILIATIDMYLVKFPLHDYADIRFGTLTSRFKDCGVISEWMYLMRNTRLSAYRLGYWVWTTPISEQVVKLTKAGEEMDQIDSYMLYYMEMRLATKSKYSVTLSPDLHVWIHAYGAVSGLTRSKNARMMTDVIYPEPLLAGAVLAYARLHHMKMEAKFIDPNEADQDENEAEEEEIIDLEGDKPEVPVNADELVDIPGLPDDMDGNRWIA